MTLRNLLNARKAGDGPRPADQEPVPAPVTHPVRPKTLQDTGVPAEHLRDLVLRLASTVPSLSTHSAAEQLCLPEALVATLLEGLRDGRMIESLGSETPLTYRYTITNRGRDHATRLFELCGYVGPAPVSLEDYRFQLETRVDSLPEATSESVSASLADLVLADDTVEVAGLACVSGRTLLIYGPPGNGKTEVGHRVHEAVAGDLWIPHCIMVDGKIIRVFDPQVHERLPVPAGADGPDGRWVRIRRPFVVVGGELTMDALELSFDPAMRCYEAPLPFKANGGTFLLDDFGCQRAEPNQLLGRWVYPLEHREDHLTMRSGQKVQVPFRQMLVVSTSLDPEALMEPAFLRRMGYRVYLGDPSTDTYRTIFRRYAERCGAAVEEEVLDDLVERYGREQRRLSGCHPRDLIERARDICRYRRKPLVLDAETLDRAWSGYFGDRLRDRAARSAEAPAQPSPEPAQELAQEPATGASADPKPEA